MVCSRRNEKGGRRETIFYCETCILEIASRSITLNNIINKINNKTLIILCNLKYIIKPSGEFIFMFFSFKTVG